MQMDKNRNMKRLITQYFNAGRRDEQLSILGKLSKYDDLSVTDSILEYQQDTDSDKREIVAEILSRYDNKKSKKALRSLLRDEEPLVRVRAAESIGILHDRSSVNDLISLLQDKNAIVRIESIDSLGAMRAKRAEEALINTFLNDRIALVRGYAAESLAEIGCSKAKEIIQKQLLTERQGQAKLGMYSALYMMGDRKCIKKVFEFLKSRYYHLRCAAVNTLLFIVEDEDMDDTIKVLSEALQKEKTIAVKSTIDKFFKELDINVSHID